MDFLKKRSEISELYNRFIELSNIASREYNPDSFIKYIHKEYLKEGIIQLRHPVYATWDITNMCNLRCKFCSANALYSSEYVQENNIMEIASWLINNGVIYVSIRGGEPSIVCGFEKILQTLVSSNIFVEVVTNGSGIMRKLLQKIKYKSNMIRFKVSLDSNNEKKNDFLRGEGSYEYAVSTIKMIKREGFFCRVQMVVTNRNKYDILSMYNFVRDLGADSFGVYFMLPVGRAKKIKEVDLDIMILKQLIKVVEISGNANDTFFEKNGLGYDSINYLREIKYDEMLFKEAILRNMIRCNCLKTRINIDFNGDIYPCDFLKYPRFLLGNVFDENRNDMSKIWNSSTAREINSISRETKANCKECLKFECSTGCMGIAFSQLGTLDSSEKCCINRSKEKSEE